MFYADLHVHSRYSRATSRNCGLESLAFWGARKGLSLIGTGDFTHPEWRREIKTKLEPDGNGVFKLKSGLEVASATDMKSVRFMLQSEISTIYKKGDKTRKVHHIVFAPELESVDRFVAKLEKIGNLHSDGRPILGMDSEHLLETTLESGEGMFLVPAHIWTPWFSVLGSKSGFDSIEECYGGLAKHIFAVETGLSSDPPMNWRVSSLDKYRLISNSDAHSPSKLAREANIFNCDIDYFSVRSALETGKGFEGTVEFFPEEGKYHLDGHRKCGVRCEPEETMAAGGVCRVCGKPLTLGVCYRVAELADKPYGRVPPEGKIFKSIMPLTELLSELIGVGPNSKKVAKLYDECILKLGPELDIMLSVPVKDMESAGWPMLAEAVSAIRSGRVVKEAGYDGEFGKIRVLTS